MAEANLNGAALFDVAGKSKDPERDLSALSAAARAKAIEVMGQLGKLGDETFPARILEYVGALQDVQHPHGPARRRAQGEAQDQGRAEEGGDQRPASRVPGGAGGRQRAQGGLRAAAQLRARDRLETVEKKSLSPFNDKVYGLDAHNSGAAADAGRLRSARLCALRPRDGVPRGAPASGARSGTAAAAEPLLGVDCRNLKKRKIPSSRFLAFSIMLILIPCSKR